MIGSGYNNAVFYPRAEKAAHDACRIIFAGKLSEKKGVCSLIRAMALLPKEQYTLSLAGGFGSEQQRKAIEALIAASDRSIELLGALPQDKLAAAFSEHDVFVLPSFYEGLPLVLSEAMACSLCGVCTDLPGIKAWMDRIAPQHGIRFVAPPTLVDVDTPLPSDLPAFEQHLADAIVSAADAPRSVCDLSALSWRGVAQRILDNL